MAVRYLRTKKYRIIARGFRLYRKEIDIIAYDGKILVFVEVKARHSSPFGSPEDAVSSAKQLQIKRIAEGFLVLSGLDGVECRFDVISLTKKEDGRTEIRHYKNAFAP